MIRVQVIGDRRTAKAFRKLGLKVRDLHRAWQKIGAKIKRDAIPLTPVLSSKLVNTLRNAKTKSSAVVRAGSKRVVYAGVIHYGGYNNITPTHFLTTALHQNRDYAEREVKSEIQRLISKVGLD